MPRKKAKIEEDSKQEALLDVKRKKGEVIEYRFFGPPGTGKTTRLSHEIKNAAHKYGSDAIMVASFTRAAAAELVGRDLPLKRDQVATLHAHAYRALGKPDLVETPKMYAEWNDYVARSFDEDYMISEAEIDPDDPYVNRGNRTEGDRLLSRYNTARATLMPKEYYLRDEVKQFAELWEDFKEQTHTIDFTDMILFAARDIEQAPGAPLIGFFDEAQDFTPLELSLVRKWGSHMRFVVLAGDDDQCIYAFKGASEDAFLNPPLDKDFKLVLTQSYRIPRSVHRLSQHWVKQLTHREPKAYNPRDVEGEIRQLEYSFQRGDEAERMLDDAGQYLNKRTDTGEPYRIMFLTACSYQLNTLKAALRQNGYLYHNPYRVTRGDWNPLGRGTTASRVLAYLAPMIRSSARTRDTREVRATLIKSAYDDAKMRTLSKTKLWTRAELKSWLELVKTSTFLKRGSVQRIVDDAGITELNGKALLEYFNAPEDLLMSAHGLLGWLRERLKPAYENRLDYLLEIISKGGIEALKSKPQIIIGTIHSVKGGEAEVVYLCPDLSPQGMHAYDNNPDEIIRQFYVGMTRCKESLVLADPVGNACIQL